MIDSDFEPAGGSERDLDGDREEPHTDEEEEGDDGEEEEDDEFGTFGGDDE